MTLVSSPSFRVDHIGSLIRPKRLLDARYGRNLTSPNGLAELENDCIREVVAMQEALDLQVVTDGEFRRESWRSGLVGNVDGLVDLDGKAYFATNQIISMKTFSINAAPSVKEKLRRSRGITTREFSFLKAITSRTIKITLPSPSFLHFLRGGKLINKEVYPDEDEFFFDLAKVYRDEILELAAIGATYVQLDEVPLALLCDSGIRERLLAAGEDPERLIDRYLGTLNMVLADLPAAMTVAVHFCRGNSIGESAGQGGFEPIAEKVFQQLKAKKLLLELDGTHAGGFEPLRHVSREKTVVLGLVSTKNKSLEDADNLKRRIEQASRVIPLDRLFISPQCGFSSRDVGTGLSIEDQKAKFRLLLEVADAVWH